MWIPYIYKDLHTRSRNKSSCEYRSRSERVTLRSTALLKILFVISLQTRKRRKNWGSRRQASESCKKEHKPDRCSKQGHTISVLCSFSLLQAPATWRAEEAAVGTTCAQAMFFFCPVNVLGQFTVTVPALSVICLTHRAGIPSCFFIRPLSATFHSTATFHSLLSSTAHRIL